VEVEIIKNVWTTGGFAIGQIKKRKWRNFRMTLEVELCGQGFFLKLKI